jgi:hypothetical protein
MYTRCARPEAFGDTEAGLLVETIWQPDREEKYEECCYYEHGKISVLLE